jgi:hypothetical protein
MKRDVENIGVIVESFLDAISYEVSVKYYYQLSAVEAYHGEHP